MITIPEEDVHISLHTVGVLNILHDLLYLGDDAAVTWRDVVILVKQQIQDFERFDKI